MVQPRLNGTRIMFDDAKSGDLLLMELGDKSLVWGIKAVTEDDGDCFVVLSAAKTELPLPMIFGLREIKNFIGLKVEAALLADPSPSSCVYQTQTRDVRDQRGLLSVTKNDIRLMVATDNTGEDCISLHPETGLVSRRPVGDVAFSTWSMTGKDSSGDPVTYVKFPLS